MKSLKKKITPCNHDYKMTYQGWEDESYTCTKCGDRYKLYYEDMK